MDAPVPEESLEFARKLGYSTKGLVYVLIGGMTAMWAFDMGGEKGDKAAVRELLEEQPLGKVLLGLVALGLLFYAIYRFSEAVGMGHRLSRQRSIFQRMGYGMSAVGYSLTAWAFGREMFNAFDSGDDSKRFIAWVLSWPGGDLLVAGAGLILIGVGLVQANKGFQGKYLEQLQVRLIDHGKEQFFHKAGMLGYISRAVVFVVAGGLLAVTAYRHNAEEYDGTKGAFEYLANLPFGGAVLGAVAIGLFVYGLFMFVIAIYGKEAPDLKF